LTQPARRRPAARLAIIAWLAAVLAVVWWYPFFASGDGPSHVYNAEIIRQAWRGTGPQLAYFEVSFRPLPNWTGHAALAWLLGFVSPPVADKIVVSGCLLAWALALDVYLGATGACLPSIALLGCALGIHLPLILGFYNFSLGVCGYLATLGLWLRGKGRSAPAIGALLLVGYFSHPITVVLTLAAIAWSWCADPLRRNSDLMRLAAASVPTLLLLGWYVLFGIDAHAPAPLDAAASGWWTRRLRELDCLWYADRIQHHLAWITTLGWIGFACASLTVARNDHRHLVGLGLVMALLAVVLPSRLGGHGGYVATRLALMAMVTALGGFALPARPRVRRVAIAVMAVVLAWDVAAFAGYQWRSNQSLALYLSGIPRFPVRRVFIPLVERSSPFRVDALAHASSYYALATDGIDLGNYEADLYYFPVRFRPDAPRPADVPTLQRRFETVDTGSAAELVDALLIWGAVPQAVERSAAFTRSFADGPLSLFVSARRTGGAS
jgi:hypothetical protein